MSDYTIYHNSRWGKSRATLQLLRDSNIDPNIVNYLTEPLNVQLLKSISSKLGIKPSSWIRKNENEYKLNNINEIINDDDQLYLAMIKFPKIIERPIVTRGNSAVIGRPPDNVLKLIIWLNNY
mgnify:FL=1